MRIHSIKASKKNYFKLETDDEPITLHQDTVFKHNLLNAKEVDRKTFNAIVKEDTYNTLMQHAINHLAKKEHSKQSLIKALKIHDKEGTTIHSIIEKLENLGYINDQKALSRMVEEAIEFDMKGPSFIRQKCLKEGFNSFDVEDALSIYTDDLQKEKIKTLMKQENKHLQKSSLQKRKEKLLNNLYRKGFTPEIFQPLVENFIASIAESTDEESLLEKRFIAIKVRYDLSDYKDKQKLIAKLLREGFSYDQIKRQL